MASLPAAHPSLQSAALQPYRRVDTALPAVSKAGRRTGRHSELASLPAAHPSLQSAALRPYRRVEAALPAVSKAGRRTGKQFYSSTPIHPMQGMLGSESNSINSFAVIVLISWYRGRWRKSFSQIRRGEKLWATAFRGWLLDMPPS